MIYHYHRFGYWLSSNCKSVPEYELLVLFSPVWDYHTHTAKKPVNSFTPTRQNLSASHIWVSISSMLEPSKVQIIFSPSILLPMLLLALRISCLKYSNIEWSTPLLGSVSGVLFGSSMEQILKQMSLSKLSYFGGVCVSTDLLWFWGILNISDDDDGLQIAIGIHVWCWKWHCWYYFCAAKTCFQNDPPLIFSTYFTSQLFFFMSFTGPIILSTKEKQCWVNKPLIY